MSRRIRVVALVVFFLLSAAGAVLALDFQPGKWQVTSKVEMPGMPAPMPPVTVNQCMTEQEPVPVKSADGQACEILEMKTEGNTVTWKMKCSDPGGGSEGSGRITYRGDSFEGSILTKAGCRTKSVLSGSACTRASSTSGPGSRADEDQPSQRIPRFAQALRSLRMAPPTVRPPRSLP